VRIRAGRVAETREESMKAHVSKWVVKVGASLSVVWLCTGCGPGTYTATDGTRFEGSTSPNPNMAAVKRSGAHDLPCAGELRVTDVAGADLSDSELLHRWHPDIAVIGCGWRVVYRVGETMDHQLGLVSRSPLTPAADARAH
jgi:hypothetical protein